MIEFHNERLAPAGLGELLYQTVPRSIHRPVIFICRGRTRLLGSCSCECIEIHLHNIYLDALYKKTGSLTARLWHELLRVCYHEFGHVATVGKCRHISAEQYRKDPVAHSYVERLADDWASARLAELQTRDSRLGQPVLLTGYLGARHAQLMRSWGVAESGNTKAAYVREHRCILTGGQFTIGDLASALGLEPWRFSNALSVIHRASDGIGINHIDRAGRRHKLYTWGDVPKIAERLDLSRLRAVPADGPLDGSGPV